VTTSISKDGSGFMLLSSMCLPRPLADVFSFFADARNLQRITPPSLSFDVLTEGPIEMSQGTRIDYRLRVHKIPLRWQSEITTWDPPFRFVDEQRKGPYRWWIHEHTFQEQDGSTMIQDRVRYSVLGGRLVNRFLVGRDLRSIFAFRSQALHGIFADETTAEALGNDG